jgi:hypothetical protein
MNRLGKKIHDAMVRFSHELKRICNKFAEIINQFDYLNPVASILYSREASVYKENFTVFDPWFEPDIV